MGLSQGGHLGWGVSSGQHLSHHPEDWDFEPLDDDHEPATDATVAKARVPVGEDEKVDKQWLRVLDLSLEMVRPSFSLSPGASTCRVSQIGLADPVLVPLLSH